MVSLIGKAHKDASRTPVNVKDSRVLTLLTLGFWYGLVKNNLLWCKYIYKIFPKEVRKKVKLRQMLSQMNLILKVRNKIAHHERILNKSGISIILVMECITNLTLSLVEREDSEFRIYIEQFLSNKAEEVKLINNQYK